MARTPIQGWGSPHPRWRGSRENQKNRNEKRQSDLTEKACTSPPRMRHATGCFEKIPGGERLRAKAVSSAVDAASMAGRRGRNPPPQNQVVLPPRSAYSPKKGAELITEPLKRATRRSQQESPLLGYWDRRVDSERGKGICGSDMWICGGRGYVDMWKEAYVAGWGRGGLSPRGQGGSLAEEEKARPLPQQASF